MLITLPENWVHISSIYSPQKKKNLGFDSHGVLRIKILDEIFAILQSNKLLKNPNFYYGFEYESVIQTVVNRLSIQCLDPSFHISTRNKILELANPQVEITDEVLTLIKLTN